MPKGPVFISTGVLVELPHDVERCEVLMDRIMTKVEAAMKDALADEVSVEIAPGGFHFDWLGEDFTNAARCARCARWISDVSKPDVIPALTWGERTAKGELVCCEHRHEDDFLLDPSLPEPGDSGRGIQ